MNNYCISSAGLQKAFAHFLDKQTNLLREEITSGIHRISGKRIEWEFRQNASGRLHPRCGQGICRTRHLGALPDGYSGQETPERVAFHKSQGMGNPLTQIEDIVPIVQFPATDGWWITGQASFANGGYPPVKLPICEILAWRETAPRHFRACCHKISSALNHN